MRAKFYDLTKELGELGAWVRLHYVYPYPHVDEVIPLMAEGKVLPYLDMPLQHAEPVGAQAHAPARQPGAPARPDPAAGGQTCPDLAIRSTFIVGFPGETEAEFEELLAWLQEAKLDRVGCFEYEPVAGATANALGDPVPPEVKAERKRRFMEAQNGIALRLQRAKVGKRLPMIVDAVEGGVAKGRSKADAPGDRRHRPRRLPAPGAGRRHRHREDRPGRGL